VPPTATSATQDDVGYYLAGGDIHDLKFFSSLMLIDAQNPRFDARFPIASRARVTGGT
jgi:hypothetical protein